MNKRENIIIGNVSISPAEQDIISGSIITQRRCKVAGYLNKSKHTVEAQLKTLFIKLGIESFTGLVLFARANGYDENGKYIKAVLLVLQLCGLIGCDIMPDI